MTAHDADSLLRMDAVEKTYTMGTVTVPALKPTTFTVRRGEFLIVLGPSGSGKTTLLNLIGGIDTPTGGHLYYQGDDLADLADDALTAYRRYTVGFVFQFFNLVPTLTALENVQLVAELVEHPQDARDALASVGLGDRTEHFPSELSGGEQQRVAIARALVKRPALLLADEPTGNLDFETGIKVLSVLTELARAGGITVIVVTHNSTLAAIADRVIRMRSGEIIGVEENASPKAPGELTW
ncbi:MAG: putative ABC transporter ATP-binding protein [bacterium ADurb.Bin429]|nr:MAG: putative ABC transporter ATP-binding protein [bacterium ADurb.Bin429]